MQWAERIRRDRQSPANEGVPWYATLRVRLIVSVAIVHVILMGGFIWEAVQEQSASIRSELESRGNSLVNLMAVASTNALLSEDLASLAEVTARVKHQPDVAYGLIADERGEILASTSGGELGRSLSAVRPPGKDDKADLLQLVEPIHVAGREVGRVYLGLSTLGMQAELHRIRNEGLLYILAALLVGSAAAWMLSFVVTRNLQRLGSAVQRISAGDKEVRVDARGRDEVGVLGRAFNGMLDSLNATSRAAAVEHEKRVEAERLACVGELAASIAHEIRNPLAAVINSVSLLAGQGLEPADQQKVRHILDDEAGRLQRILENFLHFSKIRESHPRPGDLEALLEEVITLFSQDPDVVGRIEISSRIAGGHGRAVFDQDQLRQVMWNLMRNAVDAMPAGGKLEVLVETGGDRQLAVRVRDTGEGIPIDLVDRVMRPFISGRKQGTGLGLSIVQRILVQHGSSLRIRSRPGEGTEMSFELESV